jgi:4-amino-4-deoxy-L-arabinose transferase-like glycosyltransferase
LRSDIAAAFPDSLRGAAFSFAPAQSVVATGDWAKVAFWAALALVFGLRLALAASLPLSFDEAYYWLWSKHLALGYYEHPAAIALAIRAGTALFGDRELGVRAIPLLLCLPTSWAVWRSGAALLGDKRNGALACLLFNATLMVAAESMGATPDALLVAAAAFLLWTIAELQASSDGRWWLAAGIAAGLAIASKYTGLFLCGSLTLWLLANSGARAWLRTGWPYAGALIAASFSAPTLYWNATHGFVSFGFQFGRVASVHSGHFLEFLGGQILLGSPFILALAGLGLARNGLAGPRPLSFAAAMVWPALLYFAFHALHDRVQGNWPCFVYPALALLAAQSFASELSERSAYLLRQARRLAFPAAALILAAAYAQAFLGALPIGKRDPIARMMGVGFAPVAEKIAEDAARVDAHAIVTTNYSATSWLAFYSRSPLPLIQISDETRLLSAARATRADLVGTLLYVTANPHDELPDVARRFSQIGLLARLVRARNGDAIDSYYVYEISGFHGSAVGRLP